MRALRPDLQQHLQRLFESFTTGIRSVKTVQPRKYLESISLDYQKLNIGFSSGQFHHRKPDEWRQPYIELGVLSPSDTPLNSPDRVAYTCFGFYGVVFPMKDYLGKIVNMYAVRFKLESPVHQYLNSFGIYPGYPPPMTRRLYVTTTVVEAASIIQSDVLDGREAVIALHDGKWLEQHNQVIQGLEELEEIIFLTCMDLAEITNKIREVKDHVLISKQDLPDGISLNMMLANGEIAAINELIHQKRTPEVTASHEANRTMAAFIPGLASPEKKVSNLPAFDDFDTPGETKSKLHLVGDQHLLYMGVEANYHAKGRLSNDLSDLSTMLIIEDRHSQQKFRHKLDLYDAKAIKNIIAELSEQYAYNENNLSDDLTTLVDLLEKYRDKQFEQVPIQGKRHYSNPHLSEAALETLTDPDLLKRLDGLIEQAGVVGEENTRLSLFVFASTYKMPQPIHVLVQGSTGSGKSHLLNTIAACIPGDDVLSMTRVSSRSFYHYGEDELTNKLLLIQDYDGLDDEAQYALREMQSAKGLSFSTTIKDRSGNLRARIKQVTANFASIVATTKAEVYADNMDRSIIIGIDESEQQTLKILMHQNRLTAGLVDLKKVEDARQQLQWILRHLKSKPVINHFAEHVLLPMEASSVRRLNSQFQALVSQVTILHQFQRNEDEYGRLMATLDDLKMAVDLFTEAVYLKTDELDSSTRQFFERLKKFVKSSSNGTTAKFTARDVRQSLGMGKTQVFRFLEQLRQMEYVSVSEGSANRGFKYVISYWDDSDKIRAKVKAHLQDQIVKIETLQTNAAS